MNSEVEVIPSHPMIRDDVEECALHSPLHQHQSKMSDGTCYLTKTASGKTLSTK